MWAVSWKFIISLGMCKHISSKLLFRTGKGLNLCTIDLQVLQRQVREKNGVAFTDALIGLHAFTGCDSVSGLHGNGKNSFAHPTLLMVRTCVQWPTT